MAPNGRSLTTHVGRLPRPDDLIAMMWAREDGIPVDRAAMEERVCRAVDEAVARQIQAGVDIVNDGEWGKPSYATYIKDRLNGFGGTGNTYVFQDIEAFPQTKARVMADPGRTHRKAPACDAPISVRDMEAPRKDAERLKTALKAHGAAGAFLTAASPGVTAFFFRNEYYRTHEDYVFAIAEAMRDEYQTIAAAGVTLQVDCPDLAMGRHTQFKDLDLAGFRARMELNVEALNRALVNIPAGQVRMHLCWGNYPGPHHCDVPLQDIVDVVWRAKPHAIQFEAANPRHAHECCFRIIPFDPVLRDRQSEPARRETWLRDQYKHPEEHRHTLAEVQGWFAENGVDYLRAYPSAVLGEEPEELFARAADNWRPEGWLGATGLDSPARPRGRALLHD